MTHAHHDFAKETAAAPDNRPVRPAAELDRVEGDELGDGRDEKSERGSAAPAPDPKAPRRDARDRVDEASEDSFPASDPPSRWAGKDEPPPKLNGE